MSYYNFKAQSSSETPAYYLGTLNHGATLNVAAKYDGYANLTAANFLVVPQSNSSSASGYNTNYVDVDGWTEYRQDTNTAAYNAPSVNYNPSTGQLSFASTLVVGGNSYGGDVHHSDTWCFTYPSATVGLTAKVYLLPKIENL